MVGGDVRILATLPITYTAPEVPLGELDTYDPHIVGKVVELWRSDTDPGRARAKITNACRRNSVREVEMELPIAYSGLRQEAGSVKHGEAVA